MAVLSNTTITTDMAKAISIDFVERFGGSLTKLYEALGVTRQIPMAEGSTIKRYKKTATIASGTVAEGDEIPLSKIKYKEDDPITLTLDKHRKLVTAEAIQKSGFDAAVETSDADLIRELQKAIRVNFFSFLGSGTGVATATDLQGALARAWGYVQTKFEDDGVQTVAFVNPEDIADYLSSANVTLQTVFGMQYIENFLNTRVLTSTLVEKGALYATAPENIVNAYIDVRSGALNQAFSFTSDETGYIGVVRDVATSRLSVETVTTSGIALFAEKLDGIVKVSFGGANPEG